MQAFCNTSCDFHIEKTGCSEPIKNKLTLIFTMLHYLKKNKEKHLKMSLFYTCVPKILII